MQADHDPDAANARRIARRVARQDRVRRRRRRATVIGALVLVAAIAVGLIASSGGSGGRAGDRRLQRARALAQRGRRASSGGLRPADRASAPVGARVPGQASVPILMYHVINEPPPGAPFPGLYVPTSEFAEQMQALASAGFHAVTMDQMLAYWRDGTPLPAGKPIVLSFDNGYSSQYNNALPVLRKLGWAGVENLQLSGLPPSQGGLSQSQIRGLLAAGWELDTQGISHADLITLDSEQLHYQVAVARETLKRRYGVPVRWFCYPSGHYDQAVIDAVKEAGYVGSTTVVPGWASPAEDPYRLPRLRVLGGTSGQTLVGEIAGIRDDIEPPPSYGSS